MRHAAPRKSSRMGTMFRTTAVSAFVLGSLTVAAGAHVHASAVASQSVMDDETARVQKQKAKAVAAAAEETASRPVMDDETARILKMKAVAAYHAQKG